jgi:signal transduction histidine kinase
LPPVYTLLAMGVYILMVMLLVSAIAYLFKLWIPPASTILLSLLVYPLWSCCRLNSAQAALDHALQNLQDELTRLGMEQQTEVTDPHEDPQQLRILKLASAAKHLRDMHKSRSDTLAFISHDIRAPLGAAMLLLDKFEHNKHLDRMKHLLQRAHAMAEGFLQASRAEMADVNKFKVLDMVSLTQQAIDDVYELAIAKNITLQADFPENNAWVRGDFGLLFRSVLNILLNAINYSPEHSVIKVVLRTDVVVLHLNVVDQGPGIAEDKIQKLFKRFSRIEGEHQNPDGSGLGLYFVGITIRKHRGSVTVQNRQGQGAEFVITLPVERRKNNIPVMHDRRVEQQSAFDDTI